MAAVIQLIVRPAIHRGDGQDVGLRGRKTWALLALVSLSERPVARQQLVRMLFPEAMDPMGALRWALSEVRRGVGDHASVGGDPVTLRLTADTVVDAQQVLLLAERRGDLDEALRWLDAARTEPSDNPKICRWIEVNTLDAICNLSAKHRLPRARAVIAQLAGIAAAADMPDYLARSRGYAASLNERTPVRGGRQ